MKNRIFILLLCMLLLTGGLPVLDVYAADSRILSLWFGDKSCGTEVVDIDVLKTYDASYGLAFTYPVNEDDPECLTSGYCVSNGMIRLTADDELVLSSNWIEESAENLSSLTVRKPFSRNEWHNIRAVCDKTSMQAAWYLDGEAIGVTRLSAAGKINCVSVYTASGTENGISVGEAHTPTAAEKAAGITQKYTALHGNTQGKNNWYFCEFGKNSTYELKWDSENGRWISSSTEGDISSGAMAMDSVMKIGYRFVSPKGGVVRLRGRVNMPYANSSRGDGCTAYVYHNGELKWQRPVIYGIDTEYDFVISVDSGDELVFAGDCGQSIGSDWIKWNPTVEYTDIKYNGDTDYTYYLKKGISRQILGYDAEADANTTGDKIVYIGSSKIKITDGATLGKRYTVPENGRYRIYGHFYPDDVDGVTVVNVYKNNNKIWSQLFPGGEKNVMDVRVFAESGDKLDAEVTVTGCRNGKEISYRCEINKFIGTLFCDMDMNGGDRYRVTDEYTMAEFIEQHRADGRAKFYSYKNDVAYNMIYSVSLDRWISDIPNSNGYIASDRAFSGDDTDAEIELTSDRDGILKIDGDMRVCDFGDGVISKIYINDRLLWSSRVGGERPVRWDEPYDVSYFLNKVNVTAMVRCGDKLRFTFDQWRKSRYDEVDFSDISVKYISGNVLSETTEWKLKQSVVADTETSCVYIDGKRENVRIIIKDGTAYIARDDAERLTGEESARGGFASDGLEYIPLCDILADMGKNVIQAADRLVIAYDGIPVMFGYSEQSELETMLCGEHTQEDARLSVTNSDGEETEYIESGSTYYIKTKAENYTGDEIGVRLAVAYYNADGVLMKIDMSERFMTATGDVFDTEQMTEDVVPIIVPDDETASVKVFAWSGDDGIKPHTGCVTLYKRNV